MAAYPEDAVCIVDGCTLPVAGTRPSHEAYILEDEDGQTIAEFPAGEADEIVCAVHAEEN